MFAPAHQCEFDLVLNVFNVDRATGRHAAGDRAHHAVGQYIDRLVNAGRRRGVAAFNGEEGLGDGDLDFVAIKHRDLAITTNDLEFARRGGGEFGWRGGLILFCGPTGGVFTPGNC